MNEWTTAVWGAVGSAFIVGLMVGMIFVRFTNRNVQKQLQLEADLKATQAKVDQQKHQLEQHFAQSASLLSTLAEDYKKLYDHLAQSSTELLPEENQTEFFKLAQKEISPTETTEEPKDYSEGSSGLLKN